MKKAVTSPKIPVCDWVFPQTANYEQIMTNHQQLQDLLGISICTTGGREKQWGI